MDEVQTDPNMKAAIQEMERAAQGRGCAFLEKAKKGGKIEIEYYSGEDLDRIYDVIVPGKRSDTWPFSFLPRRRLGFSFVRP